MKLEKTVELPPVDTWTNLDEEGQTYLTHMKLSIQRAFQKVRSDLTNFSLLTLLQKSSDPPAPAEGKTAIWMSDGTGKGDAGDVMIASTTGGATKYTTLFDHSAGSAW